MAITWQFESSNLLVINVSGRVNHHDIIGHLDEIGIAMERWAEISVLVICAKDLQLELLGEHALFVSDNLKQKLCDQQKGILAFVSSADYIYGLCRQLGMRVEGANLIIGTFRTEQEARNWIREVRHPVLA